MIHHFHSNDPLPLPLKIVFWETTSLCNLECAHCRRIDTAKNLSKEDLSTEQAKKLILSISSFSNPILILSGGEPLLRDDIFSIAHFSVENNIKVALATNGTLISDGIVKEILKSKISRVSISLDGADAKTHNIFRKIDGSFERAVEGIKLITDAGIISQINCTIARHNFHQIEELFNLAESLRVYALHIFLLVPVGCGVDIADEQMLSPDEYEGVLKQFLELSLDREIQTRVTCAPQIQRIIHQKLKGENISSEKRSKLSKLISKGCLAGQNVCFVSHKGDVFPCGYLPISAGNIHKQSFRDIWESSEVFKELRNSRLLKGRCGLCEFKNDCMGCRARAYFATRQIMDEDPLCLYSANPDSHNTFSK